MKIAVVGVGYVGLVSGVCLAEVGHQVTCVDLDAAKIEQLNQNRIPIFEPGLSDMVAANRATGKLHFTTDLAAALADAEAAIIAVGTPSRESDGHADLSYIYAAAESIAEKATGPLVIINKSTVPVGTGDKVEAIVKSARPEVEFHIVSNPEFLREALPLKTLWSLTGLSSGWSMIKHRPSWPRYTRRLSKKGSPPSMSIAAPAN